MQSQAKSRAGKDSNVPSYTENLFIVSSFRCCLIALFHSSHNDGGVVLVRSFERTVWGASGFGLMNIKWGIVIVRDQVWIRVAIRVYRRVYICVTV